MAKDKTAAHKAMVPAAKAMAGRGIKALTEPDLIKAAKADLQRCTARTPYVSRRRIILRHHWRCRWSDGANNLVSA